MKKTFSVTINKCDDATFKELGKNIRSLRVSKGVSQQALSEITNRDRTGLSGYETGKKVPTLYGLCDISNALNYNFKIQFEEKEGIGNMIRKEAFTEELINTLIDNLDQEQTYESLITYYLGSYDEKWEVVKLVEDEVQLKSSENRIIELTKIVVDDKIRNKRYCPIEVKYKSETSAFYGSDKLFLDLQDRYSLTECYLIKKRIVECIALEGMLQASSELDSEGFQSMKNDFVDINIVMMLYMHFYSELKMEFGLNDKEILDIIKVLDIEAEGSQFIDLISSGKAEAKKHEELFIGSLCYVAENYLEPGYIDEHIMSRLMRLASLFKLDNHVGTFLYDIHNEMLEEKIASGENTECAKMIYDEIKEEVDYCYGYLANMKNRNKDKTVADIIVELTYIFYRDLYIEYLVDVMNELFYEEA